MVTTTTDLQFNLMHFVKVSVRLQFCRDHENNLAIITISRKQILLAHKGKIVAHSKNFAMKWRSTVTFSLDHSECLFFQLFGKGTKAEVI
jgi:hypothetical protein